MKRYVIFNHPIARIGFEKRESKTGNWIEYKPEYEEAEKIRKLLDKLLIYINPITAAHRHGNKSSKRQNDKLVNLQMDIERELEELDKC